MSKKVTKIQIPSYFRGIQIPISGSCSLWQLRANTWSEHSQSWLDDRLRTPAGAPHRRPGVWGSWHQNPGQVTAGRGSAASLSTLPPLAALFPPLLDTLTLLRVRDTGSSQKRGISVIGIVVFDYTTASYLYQNHDVCSHAICPAYSDENITWRKLR